MPDLSLSLDSLKFSGFEPYAILKVFLNIKAKLTEYNQILVDILLQLEVK